MKLKPVQNILTQKNSPLPQKKSQNYVYIKILSQISTSAACDKRYGVVEIEN
jgi:hypothetical protein